MVLTSTQTALMGISVFTALGTVTTLALNIWPSIAFSVSLMFPLTLASITFAGLLLLASTFLVGGKVDAAKKPVIMGNNAVPSQKEACLLYKLMKGKDEYTASNILGEIYNIGEKEKSIKKTGAVPDKRL